MQFIKIAMITIVFTNSILSKLETVDMPNRHPKYGERRAKYICFPPFNH